MHRYTSDSARGTAPLGLTQIGQQSIVSTPLSSRSGQWAYHPLSSIHLGQLGMHGGEAVLNGAHVLLHDGVHFRLTIKNTGT